MTQPNCPTRQKHGLRGYHFAAFGLIALAAQLGLLMFWELWPYNVFSFREPIRVLTQPAISGGLLKYEMSYCKSSSDADYASDVQIIFISQQLIYTPFYKQSLESGCHKLESFAMLPDMPPGRYKIMMYREYEANPVRRLAFRSESNEFDVIDAKEAFKPKK